MPHTQVLNRSKVFYTVAFDLLMVQQSPKEARLFPTQTLMALAEMEVPTNRLAWRRLRVRGEFQSTTDQRRIKSQCPLPIAHYPLPETSLCGSRVNRRLELSNTASAWALYSALPIVSCHLFYGRIRFPYHLSSDPASAVPNPYRINLFTTHLPFGWVLEGCPRLCFANHAPVVFHPRVWSHC